MTNRQFVLSHYPTAVAKDYSYVDRTAWYIAVDDKVISEECFDETSAWAGADKILRATSISQRPRTGRFQVGRSYTFVRTLFERGDDQRRIPLYRPWIDKNLRIETITLLCAERHRVPEYWDRDNKLTCDGYLFTGPDGQAWRNQLPRASYGQLDDSNDRQVRRHYSNKQLFELDACGEPLRVYKKDGSGSYSTVQRPGSEPLWAALSSDYDHPWTLATVTLGAVYRALNPRADRNEVVDLTPQQTVAFRAYFRHLEAVVEDAEGARVVYEPLSFKSNTGEMIVTSYMVARIREGRREFPTWNGRQIQRNAVGDLLVSDGYDTTWLFSTREDAEYWVSQWQGYDDGSLQLARRTPVKIGCRWTVRELYDPATPLMSVVYGRLA